MAKNDIESFISKISDNFDITSGQRGLEKESLRIFNSGISKREHPKHLGSALCNRLITTDFSESQIELITPPKTNNKLTLTMLNNIHHYISLNIEAEFLWPFSIPPLINSEDDIPIAYYGDSNQGAFKEIYRRGLANRYGRMMQAISGIHFNYSPPSFLFDPDFLNNNDLGIGRNKSEILFGGIRNLHRMNWLVLYLFGASPVITKNFLNNNYEFKKLSNDTYYLPYATSLRMSDLGYQNQKQASFNISLNTIDEYINNLYSLTATASNSFSKIDTDKWNQLNSNILQNEDELYSIARPKNNDTSHRRQLSKLSQLGVDYIEYRSIDLNPFSRIGIDLDTINFLEIFMLYCIIKPSPMMNEEEFELINKNNNLVSTFGRDPNLELLTIEGKSHLKYLALKIIDDLYILLSAVIDDKKEYSKALELAKEKIISTENILSHQMLDIFNDSRTNFNDFGCDLGLEHKNYFKYISSRKNEHWDEIEQECSDSIRRQKIIEDADSTTLDEFVSEYFESI